MLCLCGFAGPEVIKCNIVAGSHAETDVCLCAFRVLATTYTSLQRGYGFSFSLPNMSCGTEDMLLKKKRNIFNNMYYMTILCIQCN